MAADPDPPEDQPGRPSSPATGGRATERQQTPWEVAESATELDLNASAPPTVRPGLKRATLVADRESDVTPLPGADPERSPSDYLGYIIDGRYHVKSIIAQGGMGVVYLCRHRTIDKAVAVKILRPDLAGDRDVTERFLVEARAASSVGNRHIIDVTDFGELPDGATYLVMEFLEGISLAARMKGQPAAGWEEIVEIGCQIAEGLHAAHEAGIVHRDLKPDNIFLCREPDERYFVKILDFGIAKVASSQNKVTRAGKIFGTPHYMAPEQGAGTEVDRRTDVYSLGVMLYELCSGHVPFDAENPLGILTQHMYVAPLAPNERDPARKVPVGLEAIVLKCLSKDPDHRYASMLTLYDDLQLVRRGEMPQAVADLLARGTDELPLKRLRRAQNAHRGRTAPGTWLAAFISLALIATLFVVTFSPLDGTWFGAETVSGARPAPAADGGKAKRQRKDSYTVALVLSPIDAHVFDGNQDLGTMPISIQLTKGEVASVEVRRDGFISQSVRIDGTRSKLIVELEAMPGVDLDTPLPGGAHHDAGVRIVRLGAASRSPGGRALDAGVPHKPLPRTRPNWLPSPTAAPPGAPSPAPAPVPRPLPAPPATPSPGAAPRPAVPGAAGSPATLPGMPPTSPTSAAPAPQRPPVMPPAQAQP